MHSVTELPSVSMPSESDALYRLVREIVTPIFDIYIAQPQRQAVEDRLRMACTAPFGVADHRDRQRRRVYSHTGICRSVSAPSRRPASDLEDRYRRLKGQYNRMRSLVMEILAREQFVTNLSRSAEMLVNNAGLAW